MTENKTVLQQLYDGELYPAESINPDMCDYSKLKHSISREMEVLKQKLSPDDLVRLEKIEVDESARSDIDMFYNFKEGFRLGLLMMLELLNDQ